MVGPKSPTDQFRTNQDGSTGDFWQPDSFGKDHAECELCESETLTTVEYGIRVCDTCNQTYLP